MDSFLFEIMYELYILLEAQDTWTSSKLCERRLYRMITVHCYQFGYALHYEIEMMFARDAEKYKLGEF